MRATFTTLLLAVLATVSIAACSKSSSSTASSTDQSATTATASADAVSSDNAASSDGAASAAPAAATGAAGTPPVYPGALPAVRPEGVGMKAPPAKVKTYSTPDDFAKVKAWYQAQLKGASEMQQPGMAKTEDAFLVGQAGSGMVVLIQSFKGKTWILIGPPM